MCLALDRKELKTKYKCIPNGVLTPVSAFGHKFEERISKFLKISSSVEEKS
jgi:hypothetical protein